MCRGAECGSDHPLVRAKILLNYRKFNTTEQNTTPAALEKVDTKNFPVAKLWEDSINCRYKLKVASKLKQKSEVKLHHCYDQLEVQIHESASEAL